MSDNHTTDSISNANSAPNASQAFNSAKQQQAYELTKQPQEVQQKANTIEDIYAKRINAEKNNQQRSRAFRELKAKSQLLENYVRDNAPRPNDPQARENDLQIISSKAKEMVAQRETYFLDKIEHERFEMVNTIIQEEQQKQADPAAHAKDVGQSPSPEPEQER